MRYCITHTTHYTYSEPVCLRTHTLRLCPRSDGAQWLQQFEAKITPTPVQQGYFLDIYGNTCLNISFKEPIAALNIQTISTVSTTRQNPFDYISEPWAVQLPIDYPSSLAAQLSPYWQLPIGQGIDDAMAPAVLDMAQRLKQEAKHNVGYFLTNLTQRIPRKLDYQQRLQGKPYAPAVTLAQGSGTCRDFAVLFVAVCRSVGLAARFVSGYQEGDLDGETPHDLHAWAEVYIPGGGWRGFDPTLGLAVGDRHVAIAAAPLPSHASPVSGTLKSTKPIETSLESHIQIQA
ncbi:MAG: transglutaminase family protein [Cyanobacteria bacterium P01_D01_bin.105]